MNFLKNLPWGMIGKVAGAALGAAGLIGTGYVVAPTKEPAVVKECVEKIIFKPKIYIDGHEVKPSEK